MRFKLLRDVLSEIIKQGEINLNKNKITCSTSTFRIDNLSRIFRYIM